MVLNRRARVIKQKILCLFKWIPDRYLKLVMWFERACCHSDTGMDEFAINRREILRILRMLDGVELLERRMIYKWKFWSHFALGKFHFVRESAQYEETICYDRVFNIGHIFPQQWPIPPNWGGWRITVIILDGTFHKNYEGVTWWCA